MWKQCVIASAFIASFFAACVSDDNAEEKWSAADVCPESKRGSFTDDRDGVVYKYTTIGNQVWMAENLRYNAENVICLSEYKDVDSHKHDEFCKNYGAYYPTNRDSTNLRGVDESFLKDLCPKGWKIPSKDEWGELVDILENEKRKSDECGMSIRYAGAYLGDAYGIMYFNFDAIFMTSSLDENGLLISIRVEDDFAFFNHFPKMSIRCLKD